MERETQKLLVLSYSTVQRSSYSADCLAVCINPHMNGFVKVDMGGSCMKILPNFLAYKMGQTILDVCHLDYTF